MKLIIVLAAVLAVASATRLSVAHRQIAEVLPSAIDPRANFETELRALLEKLREVIEFGSEENGIPILDPLHVPDIDVTLDIPSTANLKIAASDIIVSGLKDFVVKDIGFSVLRLRLDFDVSIPLIKVLAAHYDLDGSIAQKLEVFGSGSVDVEALGLEVVGYATVKVSGGHLAINKIQIVVKLAGLKSDITGLLGGGEVSDELNKTLEELIPQLVATRADEISAYLEEFVTKYADDFLGDLTLSDLIDLITGGGSNLNL